MATSDSVQEKKTEGFNRRDFLKVAGSAIAFAAIPSFGKVTANVQEDEQKQVTWNGSYAVSPHDHSKPHVYSRLKPGRCTKDL